MLSCFWRSAGEVSGCQPVLRPMLQDAGLHTWTGSSLGVKGRGAGIRRDRKGRSWEVIGLWVLITDVMLEDEIWSCYEEQTKHRKKQHRGGLGGSLLQWLWLLSGTSPKEPEFCLEGFQGF